LRYLQSKNKTGRNKLIFTNKTKDDIILALEFEKILGENFINILSSEITDEYANGQIDEDFLKAKIADFNQQFYVCGPPPMMDAIKKQLVNYTGPQT
jgi:ferredoxin-NADP reductase